MKIEIKINSPTQWTYPCFGKHKSSGTIVWFRHQNFGLVIQKFGDAIDLDATRFDMSYFEPLRGITAELSEQGAKLITTQPVKQISSSCPWLGVGQDGTKVLFLDNDASKLSAQWFVDRDGNLDVCRLTELAEADTDVFVPVSGRVRFTDRGDHYPKLYQTPDRDSDVVWINTAPNQWLILRDTTLSCTNKTDGYMLLTPPALHRLPRGHKVTACF